MTSLALSGKYNLITNLHSTLAKKTKVLFFYHKRRNEMLYKLVIAEKPSVAQSIAKVIGAGKREDGYLKDNGYIVSWCVGHLVELASPESYDEKYEKWRYDDLPILPPKWNYQIAAATRK